MVCKLHLSLLVNISNLVPGTLQPLLQLNMTSEERDSAFDLSLSSQQEIRDQNSGTDEQISEDEFGDENLENFGVSCG